MNIRPEFRLISRPHRVYWAGWETTTYRLQQAGWRLSAEQNHDHGRISLFMRHDACQIEGVSEAIDLNMMERAHYAGMEPELRFVVRYMAAAGGVRLQGFESTMQWVKPIDATPQMVAFEPKSLDDFNVFGTLTARTEELIVEPATVSALLDQIRELQAPEQKAIRERMRRRERESRVEASPAHTFHAQIISFPRAA